MPSSNPPTESEHYALIEVFHTRDQNHVTAGGGSILGVTFCNSCSGSGRYDIETTCATLVKESSNVQTQHRSSGSNYPLCCSSNIILHNKHARFDENRPYTVIARLPGHCHRSCVQLKIFD